jgi:hypothetical protein
VFQNVGGREICFMQLQLVETVFDKMVYMIEQCAFLKRRLYQRENDSGELCIKFVCRKDQSRPAIDILINKF